MFILFTNASNQRTNGPVNAYLILVSEPIIITKPQVANERGIFECNKLLF